MLNNANLKLQLEWLQQNMNKIIKTELFFYIDKR